MTKSRGILPKRRLWTRKEDATLRRLYPTTRTKDLAAKLGRAVTATHQRAYALGLRKSPEYLASPASCRLDGLRGASTRFKPGQPSWNKGTRYEPGGRSVETRFRKGTLNGRAAQLAQPIGSFRVNSDGYLDLKVSDATGPQTLRWRAYHRVVWERANGPVPANHVVVFKAGRHSVVAEEITIDALELVTRQELMARNTLHRYPKEIASAIQLRGALMRQINRRTKEA